MHDFFAVHKIKSKQLLKGLFGDFFNSALCGLVMDAFEFASVVLWIIGMFISKEAFT